MVVVEDELTLVFAALADPTRRAIVARLALGEATVNQLAEPFELTQQAVSKHLKVLERARLVSRTRSGQSRPCALDAEHLDAAVGWIARHRQLWADRHDRLDEHLAALRAGTSESSEPPRPSEPSEPSEPREPRELSERRTRDQEGGR